VVPAFVGRSTPARSILARIGARAIFFRDADDRNSRDLDEDAEQEKKGNRLFKQIACSREPNAHAKNPPLSPQATERTAPVRTLAYQNTLGRRQTSMTSANFLKTEVEAEPD
jgi:hypothetical protein